MAAPEGESCGLGTPAAGSAAKAAFQAAAGGATVRTPWAEAARSPAAVAAGRAPGGAGTQARAATGGPDRRPPPPPPHPGSCCCRRCRRRGPPGAPVCGRLGAAARPAPLPRMLLRARVPRTLGQPASWLPRQFPARPRWRRQSLGRQMRHPKAGSLAAAAPARHRHRACEGRAGWPLPAERPAAAGQTVGCRRRWRPPGGRRRRSCPGVAGQTGGGSPLQGPAGRCPGWAAPAARRRGLRTAPQPRAPPPRADSAGLRPCRVMPREHNAATLYVVAALSC